MATPPPSPGNRLMTPGEVAALFRVDPKTVTRWYRAGRFRKGSCLRTPGGHLRIRESAVRTMMEGEMPTPEPQSETPQRSPLDWVSEQMDVRLVCRTCGSRDPRLHPATQAGGEVMSICSDGFHTPVQNNRGGR